MTTLDRIDGITAGVAFKAPVKTVTSAAITLSGLQTIGGVTLAAGDRVLVKNQTDAKENGIYNAATTAWSRALDFDGSRDVVNGTLVTVGENESTLRQYRLVATDPVVFGTSELTFREVTSTSGGDYGSDFGLTYDGTTDQSVALQTVLNAATGTVRLISSGTTLFLANRVKVPAGVTLDLSQITVDLGQYGEILIQGELDETPEENLYQLAATASPGATSITVDTTPQGGHTALVEDVFIVLRGENDANGIAKQRYYGRITSKDASGGAASVVLGVDPPIPSDEGTFSTTYPDSAWNPDVGGPVTDRSLITIATASLLTGNAARGDTTVAVANGALFTAGDVCMVQDDRHATDPGSETGGLPMRQELVRVRSVVSNTVTLEKALSRDFLTSENAALFKVNAVSDAHIIGGAMRQVEDVDASPESRTHATLMFFADRCSVSGVRLLEDDNSYSPRGSACRVTRSLECRVSDVWRIGPKNTSEGDGNGVMVAYSADTIVENCYLERCRHGIINQGSTRSLVRHNTTSNCLINGLDDHGVYETDSQYHDNLIVGGPSLASGSTQQLGMTLGNTRWLEGSHYSRVWANKFVGFGGGSNGGIAVRQASDDVLIQGNSFDGCEVGIRVLRDSRAGVRVTSDVVIRDNQFRDCTTNINADGGLDSWAVDVTYSGTTARPVSVLASNGREYSTATTKLGGSEPSHTSGTTDDWTHLGTAINGISGFRVYQNDPGSGSDSITSATITTLVVNAEAIIYDNSAASVLTEADVQSAIDEIDGVLVTHNSELDSLQTQINDITVLDSVAVGFALPAPTFTTNVATLTSDHYAQTAATTTTTNNFVKLANTDPAVACTVNFPTDATAGVVILCYIDTTQTGQVTFQNTGGVGTIAGAASYARTDPGAIIGFLCVENGGSAPVWRVTIVDNPTFAGLVTFSAGIKSAFVTGVSGTLTMAAHAGKTIAITGNTTVPVEDGFSCRIISGGSYDVDAGGTAVSLTSGQSIVVFTDGTTVYRSAVETLSTMPTS